jgi:site-specific DNA-methyltransferase (adenine-specific)
LEILKTLPNESAEVVITDPPYGIDYQSCKRIKDDRFPKIQNDKQPFINWIDEAYRITKDNGAIICFCRWDVEQTFLTALQESGYAVKSQIIWHKKGFGMGDLRREFTSIHENAWFGIKGDFRFPSKRPATVITAQKVDSNKLVHPNEKPVDLMAYFINSLSVPGDTVIDPFAGSGSTGEAAERCGRNSIMIEQNADYCKIIRRRMAGIEQSLFENVN